MISIVFENQDFVICDKPAGVLSTPSRFEAEDNRACLGTTLQTQMKQQIFPVNRLDFEVSGLILFAKTAEAHRAGNSWFENKTVTKTYRAYSQSQGFSHIPASVENPHYIIDLIPNQTYQWKCKMLRGKRRAYESSHGKPSLTVAQYLGISEALGGKFHTWDLQPITGRAHQLRFDMSRNGFPILGDKLYGSAVDLNLNGELNAEQIALRSYLLDFSKAPKFEQFGLPPQVKLEV